MFDYFDQFLNFENLPDVRMLKLETMQRMAEVLGHPERSFCAVHVAGSKGKGSVSAMIANILACASGRAVGIFASPHLTDFRERVMSTEGFFSDAIYREALAELREVVEKLRADGDEIVAHLTWFEMVTLFAFLVYRRAGCEWVVCEVGMGGRLDATNILQPEIAVITNIELEHTEFLGDTLAKIAREKAGIMKPGRPALIGTRHAETEPVFREVAEGVGVSELYFADEVGRPVAAKLQVLGEQQVFNAKVAAAAVRIIMPGVQEDVICKGLEQTRLPGRFEIRQNQDGSPIVLDVAHTVASMKYTIETFRQVYGDKPANLLFALAAGKDAEQIVPILKRRHFEKIYLTRPGDFKKSDLAGLKRIFDENEIAVTMAGEDFEMVIKTALEESEGGILLATGSFYLAAEVAKLI